MFISSSHVVWILIFRWNVLLVIKSLTQQRVGNKVSKWVSGWVECDDSGAPELDRAYRNYRHLLFQIPKWKCFRRPWISNSASSVRGGFIIQRWKGSHCSELSAIKDVIQPGLLGNDVYSQTGWQLVPGGCWLWLSEFTKKVLHKNLPGVALVVSRLPQLLLVFMFVCKHWLTTNELSKGCGSALQLACFRRCNLLRYL